MSRHQVEVIPTGRKFRAICACRAASPINLSQAEAQDWERVHHKEVERAKAHLSTRSPTLADQYTYYRAKQDDPAISDTDRALWKVLADGLEHRLGIASQEESMFG